MIIKIIRPNVDGNATFSNNGSCGALVNYLSKEDKDRGDDMEYFFDHDRDNVFSNEVVNTIDSYRKGLGRNDTKFYSLVIAPTSEETSKMKDPTRELREFTRECMDAYAKNFKGKNGDRKLEGKDIVYFAKIEYNRYYKGSDDEVKRGDAKQGDTKPGGNMHVHVVVSRKDKSNRYKISPCVKDKKLFHIEGLKLITCYNFDVKYEFEGAAKELEAMMIKRDGNDEAVKKYSAYKYVPKTTVINKSDQTEMKNEGSANKTESTSLSSQNVIKQNPTIKQEQKNNQENKPKFKRKRGLF